MGETLRFNPEASGAFDQGPNIRYREQSQLLKERFDSFLEKAHEAGRKINVYDVKEHPVIVGSLDEANQKVRALVSVIGMSGFQEISPEQVHFVKEKVFNKTQVTGRDTKQLAGLASPVQMDAYIKIYDSHLDALEEHGPAIMGELEDDAYDWALEQLEPPEEPQPRDQESKKDFDKRLWGYLTEIRKYSKQVDKLTKKYVSEHKEKYAWTWVDTSEEKKEIVHTLTHEIIHLVGFQRHKVTKGEKKRGKFYYYPRTGYAYETQRQAYTYHFESLNEAVVESMAMRSVSEEEGSNSLYDLDDAHYGVPGSYERDRHILETVISGIAKVKNQEKREVRARIFKGYFTGEMMHLRDIDEVFGQGTLRMYSQLDYRSLDGEQVYSLVKKYFYQAGGHPEEMARVRVKVIEAIQAEKESRKKKKTAKK